MARITSDCGLTLYAGLEIAKLCRAVGVPTVLGCDARRTELPADGTVDELHPGGVAFGNAMRWFGSLRYTPWPHD